MNEIEQILNSEDYKKISELQRCSLNVVHPEDSIYFNGAFYRIGDNDPELRKYLQEQNNNFIENTIIKVKNRYPQLGENIVSEIASRCSAHSFIDNNSMIEEFMDIDICCLICLEQRNLSQQTSLCLKNIQDAIESWKPKYYDTEVVSENQVMPIVCSQFEKHMKDSNTPLLTWGQARLVVEELAKLQKQNVASRTF